MIDTKSPEWTDEQLKELSELDKGEEIKELKPKASKLKAPENENPMLTKALEPFRALSGPTKGCEKLINAVIHKRSFTEGTLTSKPFIQYFDKREYDNFLKHPNGFVVELEIHNPFK